MNVLRSRLDGVLVLAPRVPSDGRGWFFEAWNARRYAELGVDHAWVQDNVSRSSRGVVRGLHFQNPRPQAKLVSCLDGAIWDVVVDLRADSPTFGQWDAVDLTGEDHRQIFVPAGFAHGFCVVSETAIVTYKVSDYWAPEAEAGVAWDDPDLAIPWPVEAPSLSKKDLAHPRLRDLSRDKLF